MIYISLSLSSSFKRITAVKTVTKDFAEQNRTPLEEPLKIKRGLLFEREEHRERERTLSLNDDLIGFVRDKNKRKQTTVERKNFF